MTDTTIIQFFEVILVSNRNSNGFTVQMTFLITYSIQLSVSYFNKMTQNSCCQMFNHFINEIQRIDYQSFLALVQQKYGVKEFKISQVTPINAFEIYNNVYTKVKKGQQPKTELNWWENELRIFIWILVCYVELRNIKIEDLGFPDWQFFSRLFPNKQQILFQYQALSLLKENTNARKWASQQDQIFANLVEKRGQKYKWSELAKQLYIESQRQYFRTPKQCRERWLNHLDPKKSKDEWEPKEDYILIIHVINKGKKWAEISKLLKNRRNQHSIKNRFKSLITREQKLNGQTADEQILLEQILKRYDNHFSKLRQNSMSSNSAQTQSDSPPAQEKFEYIPTTQNIRPVVNRRAFHICPPSNTRIPSFHQQEPAYRPVVEMQPIPSIYSFESISMNFADKQQRQKEIRAEMFLSTDPFDFLKRFFRSKEFFE